MKVWNLGERKKGWSDAMTLEGELLLPILLEAGYARRLDAGEVGQFGTSWAFTEKGAHRALEIEQAGRDETTSWRHFAGLRQCSGTHSEPASRDDVNRRDDQPCRDDQKSATTDRGPTRRPLTRPVTLPSHGSRSAAKFPGTRASACKDGLG